MRLALGIKTGTKVEFDVAGNEARLKVARKHPASRLEDGIGMLKYRGPRLNLAQLDPADLLSKEMIALDTNMLARLLRH